MDEAERQGVLGRVESMSLDEDRRVRGGGGGGVMAFAAAPLRASGRDADGVGWMAGVVRGRTGAPRQPHRWRRWLRPQDGAPGSLTTFQLCWVSTTAQRSGLHGKLLQTMWPPV